MLSNLTTLRHVVRLDNMKAEPVIQDRIEIADDAVAHVVIWQLAQPLPGSAHLFKYRLAYVVSGECVLRFDNESGKGDHWHQGARELPYRFAGVPALMADFMAEIARWNDENGCL